MSEAQPIYLQLAETHLRANRHHEAVAMLNKLLEAEPDNLRVRTRLADLYHTIGQDKEAAAAFLGAAQHLFDHADHAEALKLVDRALKMAPNHAGALALKARALAATGKPAEAAALLESLPDLDSDPEASALLVEQYLHGGRPERATDLAHKLFEHNPKSYELAYKVGAALVEAGTPDRGLELLGAIRGAMREAGDYERLAHALASAVQRLPGPIEPLEWLVDLYSRANDSFHLSGALGQLAEAAAAAGDLERARRAYEQLLDRNPEDAATRHNSNQVRVRMGLEPLEEAPALLGAGRAAGEPLVEAKPVPVVAEPALDEETQRYIGQALTDVDLFSSYGLTQKAVDLLETVLQRAPRHTLTLEKLLDLYLGAGNDRRTAELAAQLEQIYLERGDAANADRFAELRRRFQRAAGLAVEELAAAAQPAEFAVPTVEAEPLPAAEEQQAPEAEEAPDGEAVVHEVDLSEEWAALAHQAEEPTAASPIAAASAEAPREVELHASAAEPVAEPAVEYELALQAVAESGPSQAEVVERPPAMSSEEFLAELAPELDDVAPTAGTLEPLAPTPAAAAPEATSSVAAAPPAPPQPPAHAAEGAGPLHEVFDEFRAAMGEMGAGEEDLETHYNLGIAYREMGLLDEAIGELQKVANANNKGPAFRYAMQCCTLLGLAFMEKGQPEIARMWYERALTTPGLDPESVLALHYDLGVAQELAGDKDAALKSFSQVYAMNIDYRDIAERIASLRKRF
jgi:tetratricopeptide (TPR) repeat protein